MAVSLAVAVVAFAVAVRFRPLARIGMTANLTPTVCAGIYIVTLPFGVTKRLREKSADVVREPMRNAKSLLRRPKRVLAGLIGFFDRV